MINYIRFYNTDDPETLNDLMFTKFVFENDEYKFPFSEGTLRYCDYIPHPDLSGKCLVVLDDRMIYYALENAEVAILIQDQISYDEAIAEGFFEEAED